MIEELKTFIQVVKDKNFTKAGRKLCLAQPTVSLHIKRLEQYFNTTLIERSSKSKQVIITPAGQLVYEKGIFLITELEMLKQEVICCKQQVVGKLVLGASQTIGDHILPKLIKEFSMKYPQLIIEVIIENTKSVCQRVRDRQVDIGIIEGSNPGEEFERGDFLWDRMVLAVSQYSSLIHEENLMESLQNQVWISREIGSGTQEYLERFLEVNNIQPKHKMVFSSNFAVQEAVKSGMGITLISEHVVEHAAFDQEITILELEQEVMRKYSYISLKDFELSPAAQAFIEALNNFKKCD